MNENYNQIFDESKSISVVGLCLYIMKQWKVMLVAALVLAIAASGFSYMSSQKAYEAAQNATGMPVEPEISDYDKEVVFAKMDMMKACEDTIEEYDYYYQHSIKGKLDPNNVPQGSVTYIVTGSTDEEVLKAVLVCEEELLKDENYEKLAKRLSVEEDKAMIREVAWMSSTFSNETGENNSTENPYARLKLVVRHYNYEDCEEMLAFYEEEFIKCKDVIAAQFPEVKMERAIASMIICCDRSLAPLKKDIRNGELTSYETISNLKKNMSEEQMAYYEYLVAMENYDESAVNENTAAKPSVNIVLAILAAVAGAVCVAGFYAVLYLFGGRVHNVDELKSWLSTPIIGAENGAEMMAAQLEAIAAKCEAKQIYVTGSGAEVNESLLAELKNVLKGKNIEAFTGSSLLKDAKAFALAAECGAVVLVEKCNVSKEKDIRETIVKASSCGIQVLGIVLEK
jgi:hypothetical protein